MLIQSATRNLQRNLKLAVFDKTLLFCQLFFFFCLVECKSHWNKSFVLFMWSWCLCLPFLYSCCTLSLTKMINKAFFQNDFLKNCTNTCIVHVHVHVNKCILLKFRKDTCTCKCTQESSCTCSGNVLTLKHSVKITLTTLTLNFSLYW